MKRQFWAKILGILGRYRSGSCHGQSSHIREHGLPKIAIVGSANVGKSAVFNRLTGIYVTVSNYPGTTVDVSRGKAVIEGQEFEVVDTPGIYSLLPISEEERVARSILLVERPEIVLHVVDAKNLKRMLILTVQLIEAGLPTILDLNMVDETQAAGVEIGLPPYDWTERVRRVWQDSSVFS